MTIGTIGVSLSGQVSSTGSLDGGLISGDNSSIVMVDKASSNSCGKDSSSQGVSMTIPMSSISSSDKSMSAISTIKVAWIGVSNGCANNSEKDQKLHVVVGGK